ncbi:DUF4037 domain-containing protein [Saccharothrix yanglingensis]|uniref:DUF4037 domain-containing protein n=1 Tax=Saccharothrix yanglingensis TaxID=659496 RepID=UPI0027D2C357|nr:DUF4037 domain-containing protein [Saccharothrix yanglingensis]
MGRHVLACQWLRVSQEEGVRGPLREVGDELGSAVVAARLVRDLMRPRLLLDRRYPPHSKWPGIAFARYADPEVAALPLVGAVDQHVDSTDVLSHPTRPAALRLPRPARVVPPAPGSRTSKPPEFYTRE